MAAFSETAETSCADCWAVLRLLGIHDPRSTISSEEKSRRCWSRGSEQQFAAIGAQTAPVEISESPVDADKWSCEEPLSYKGKMDHQQEAESEVQLCVTPHTVGTPLAATPAASLHCCSATFLGTIREEPSAFDVSQVASVIFEGSTAAGLAALHHSRLGLQLAGEHIQAVAIASWPHVEALGASAWRVTKTTLADAISSIRTSSVAQPVAVRSSQRLRSSFTAGQFGRMGGFRQSCSTESSNIEQQGIDCYSQLDDVHDFLVKFQESKRRRSFVEAEAKPPLMVAAQAHALASCRGGMQHDVVQHVPPHLQLVGQRASTCNLYTSYNKGALPTAQMLRVR